MGTRCSMPMERTMSASTRAGGLVTLTSSLRALSSSYGSPGCTPWGWRSPDT